MFAVFLALFLFWILVWSFVDTHLSIKYRFKRHSTLLYRKTFVSAFWFLWGPVFVVVRFPGFVKSLFTEGIPELWSDVVHDLKLIFSKDE